MSHLYVLALVGAIAFNSGCTTVPPAETPANAATTIEKVGQELSGKASLDLGFLMPNISITLPPGQWRVRHIEAAYGIRGSSKREFGRHYFLDQIEPGTASIRQVIRLSFHDISGEKWNFPEEDCPEKMRVLTTARSSLTPICTVLISRGWPPLKGPWEPVKKKWKEQRLMPHKWRIMFAGYFERTGRHNLYLYHLLGIEPRILNTIAGSAFRQPSGAPDFAKLAELGVLRWYQEYSDNLAKSVTGYAGPSRSGPILSPYKWLGILESGALAGN